MYMFDSAVSARLDAIGKLGFTNPFGPERPELEAIIVGKEVARSSLWSRPIDWPLGDPALPAIQDEAERQMASAQAGLARGDACSEAERDLIRGVALYVLYYRYDAELYQQLAHDSGGPVLERRKCSTRSGMSSRRSRSGGNSSLMTFSRW